MIQWLPRAEAASHLGVPVKTLDNRAGRYERTWCGPTSRWLYACETPDAPRVPEGDTRRLDSAPSSSPWVILSVWDAHFPDVDRPTWEAFLQCVGEYQPDEIVIGGDFADLESASTHGGNPNPPSVREDIDATRRGLSALRRAARSAEISYIEGNHETRLRRKITKQLRELYDVADVDWPSLLRLDEFDIKHYKTCESRPVWRGDLAFVHGASHAKHHAAAMTQIFAPHSVVYGHTHRPQFYSRTYLDRDGRHVRSVAYGMPCARAIHASYMVGPTGWVNGFGLHRLHETGHTETIVATMDPDGRCRLEGRTYGSEP